MGDDNWRAKFAALVSTFERAWAFKSRVVLGAAIAATSLVAPVGTSEAKAEVAVVAPAPGKQGKLAGKFMLERTKGAAGKTFAGHSSHSSHSSHRSHSSHFSGALRL